jgi:hypothetical protein
MQQCFRSLPNYCHEQCAEYTRTNSEVKIIKPNLLSGPP